MKNNDLTNPYSIIHNFEVSVILPFYKKLNEFKRVLPLNAPFFQRNGIEVVISMDENSQQKELIDFLKSYPFINWRVIVNDHKHEWRNPAKAINVGIRHATKKYIMVCSPESEFHTDAIYLMREALEYYDHHFAIGTVAFALEEDLGYSRMNFTKPYGSIMTRKADLIAVKGYNESLLQWGGDDDNIRARLELYGIKKLFLPEVKLIHREKDRNGQKKRLEKRARLSPSEESDIYYPSKEFCANQEKWGEDFDRIVYDWKNNRYAGELAEKYLRRFEDYRIQSPDVFSRKYNRIILTQSFNEQEYIIRFLENMGLYFDGIILLDDGSTDHTYELAEHSKLLLKVKKKREGFIDIENRNITLDLASFFSCEWFCFMDTDELFDERFINFDEAASNENVDVIHFSFVNLWNSEQTYNAEYPYSRNGIMEKPKMFKNIGHTQIYTNKVRMHFQVIPYRKNSVKGEIFYRHYGMISKELRIDKYLLYQKEDIANDQKSYEHIMKDDPKLLQFEDICYKERMFYNQED